MLPERMVQAGKFAKEGDRAFDEVAKAMKGRSGVPTFEQRKILDRTGAWMHG